MLAEFGGKGERSENRFGPHYMRLGAAHPYGCAGFVIIQPRWERGGQNGKAECMPNN